MLIGRADLHKFMSLGLAGCERVVYNAWQFARYMYDTQ